MNVNSILSISFIIEMQRRDFSGIYALTQITFGYNSNKIEGSVLTEEQTASLFNTGSLPKSDGYYRAKDIEEMNGHFLMFNLMINTLDQELSEDLIKRFHYELKSGVFEDRANGYAIGDYKTRPNIVGNNRTTLPKDVSTEMKNLLEWYNKQEKSLTTLAQFHTRYETIHPFQDGNGRTGRLILFRECLNNDLVPFIIEDKNRNEYIEALKIARDNDFSTLTQLFRKEQKAYKEEIDYFMQNYIPQETSSMTLF